MKPTDEYCKQDVERTLSDLEADKNQGLSDAEVERRLAEYGYNELSEHEETFLHRLMRRFWGPIPWMIEAAAILSAVVHKWDDFAIITVMLLVNAALDFLQENRALNALKALKQQTEKMVTVKRNGDFTSLPAKELVPGDIVEIRLGEMIPADVQLADGEYLSIEESALTGESLPVTKKTGDAGYANTIVRQGEMTAVVVNTANSTRFHSVVALVAEAQTKERSHFQRMVMSIGNFLIMVTIGLALIILVTALFRHENFLDISRFVLVLTVAAIPVALPAVMSVTMAIGALRLAKKKAIVSRLAAIEELAGVDVFCSDKTGTLTKNEMKVQEPVVYGDFTSEDLFTYAVLASKRENRDPVETPIFDYFDQEIDKSAFSEFETVSFRPFDPVRKRTKAIVRRNGKEEAVWKGAPQKVLRRTPGLSDEKQQAIIDKVDQLAGSGYRTLGVARKVGDEEAEFVGLIPMYDPPRDDSSEVVASMQENGVDVKMITGDHLAIAKEIGKMLGLKEMTMRGSDITGENETIIEFASTMAAAIYMKLKGEVSRREAQSFAEDVIDIVQSMYDVRLIKREFVHTHQSALVELIEEANIFAEVVPEHKYHIVDTLQKGNHIVGMTGDGVNDAPALKKADCGIAVSGATDAAKGAADIILTAPGLSVINDAIREARLIFERMKSYAMYRIAETIRIILFMTLSILAFNFYPVTALMIILLALLNDIPIMTIAYDSARVDRKPVRWNMTELLAVASNVGIMGVISTFALYYWLKTQNLDTSVIQTLMFLKLVVAGHFTIFNTRKQSWWWVRPMPSFLLLNASFWSAVVGTLIAVYGLLVTPTGWSWAGIIWLWSVIEFNLNDAVKVGTYGLLKRSSHGD